MWLSNMVLSFILFITASTCIPENAIVSKSMNVSSIRNGFEYECVTCSQDVDGNNCLFKPSEMKKCNTSIDQCYTVQSGGLLFRGCVGDDIIGDEESCADKSDHCTICSGKRCNDQQLIAEKCMSHSYSKGFGPDDHNIRLSQKCPLAIKSMGCYHLEDNIHGIIRKGCANELSTDDRNYCRKNGPDCKICYGIECNYRLSFQTCLTCDSKDNSKCIVPDGTLPTELCKDYHDECYTYTVDNAVQRGCLSHTSNRFRDSCRLDVAKCDLCRDYESCNKNVINDTCIKCDSDIDPSCRDCPQLKDEFICSANSGLSPQGCFLQISDHRVIRGCVQDLLAVNKAECNSQSSECQLCYHRNCNIKKYFKQKCHSCSGIVDDLCAIGKSNGTIECPDYSSSCLVGIDFRGFTHRSISTIKTNDQRMYSNGFELCFEDYCNDDVFPKNRRLCYQGNANGGQPTACRVYANDEECFVYVDEENKEHRGCLSDSAQIKSECRNKTILCKTCSTDACNNFSFNLGNIPEISPLSMLIYAGMIIGIFLTV